MKQNIPYITLLVNDYDEAIEFYTTVLGFLLTEDTRLTPTKRWVIVTPNGGNNGLLLAKAGNDAQKAAIGNQAGGRVFLFLHTDDFNRDYQKLIDNNVKIIRQPSAESYGTVAVFEDLYGNLWDIIQPA